MSPNAMHAPARVRLDKWLWVARFFRTRSLAAQAVEAGRVRAGGERVKPARAVSPGERLEIVRDGLSWEVEVLGLAQQRGPASAAALLYLEGEASRTRREEALALRKASGAGMARLPGRPTKKQRRDMEQWRRGDER